MDIYTRKKLAIELLKKNLVPCVDYYEALTVATDAIDCYITLGENIKCKCGTVISKRNKTGMCRNCRRNYLRHTRYLENETKNSKIYRKRRKVNLLKNANKI